MKKVIHFSDGEKAVCGAKDEQAELDPQVVTCEPCQAFIDARAIEKGDPVVRAVIHNRDLKDGQDWNFTYEGVHYHCVSAAVHRIPQSVAEHLKQISYPESKYEEGRESGDSVVSAGVRHRFIVQILGIAGFPLLQPAGENTTPLTEGKIPIPLAPKTSKKTAKKSPGFKEGDPVYSLSEGEEFPGVVTSLVDDEFVVEFEDGEEGSYPAADLVLIEV